MYLVAIQNQPIKSIRPIVHIKIYNFEHAYKLITMKYAINYMNLGQVLSKVIYNFDRHLVKLMQRQEFLNHPKTSRLAEKVMPSKRISGQL